MMACPQLDGPWLLLAMVLQIDVKQLLNISIVDALKPASGDDGAYGVRNGKGPKADSGACY